MIKPIRYTPKHFLWAAVIAVMGIYYGSSWGSTFKHFSQQTNLKNSSENVDGYFRYWSEANWYEDTLSNVLCRQGNTTNQIKLLRSVTADTAMGSLDNILKIASASKDRSFIPARSISSHVESVDLDGTVVCNVQHQIWALDSDIPFYLVNADFHIKNVGTKFIITKIDVKDYPGRPSMKQFFNDAKSINAGVTKEAIEVFQRPNQIYPKQNPVKCYDEAINKCPRFALAYYKRACSLFSKGDNDQQALKDFDKTIELLPNYPGAYLCRSALHRQMKNFKKCRQDLDHAIALEPQFEWSYKLRGDLKMHLKDFTGALTDFNKAIEQNNSEFRFYLARADAYENLHQHEFAAADLEKARSLNPEDADINFVRPTADSDLACELYYAAESVRLQKGVYHMFRHELDAAIKELDAVQKSSSSPYCRSMGAYYNANCRIMRGDLWNVVGEFDQHFYGPKDSSYYHRLKGSLYCLLEDYKNALDELNLAISLNSKVSDSYAWRGWVKTELGDIMGAAQDTNKAVELSPSSCLALECRAHVRIRANANRGALTDIEKAINLAGKSCNKHSNVVLCEYHYVRAEIKLNLGDKKGAMADFDTAINYSPKESWAYFKRGEAYLQLGEKEKARKDFRKALSLNANFAVHHLNLLLK